MRIPRWVSVVLSGVLLAVMFAILPQYIDIKQVSTALRPLSLVIVAAATVVMWLNFAVTTIRLRVVMRRLYDRPPGFISLFQLNLLSLFITHLSPVGAAADVARIGYARVRMNIPIRIAVESIVFDRILGLFGIVLLAILLMPIQWAIGVSAKVWIPQVVLWIFCVLALTGLHVMARHQIIQRWRVVAEMGRSVQKFFSLFTLPGDYVIQGLLALGYSGTFSFLMWLLARAMGFTPDLIIFFAFGPLMLLAQNMPIFYVGWGAREAVALLTLGGSGVLEPAQALAVSVATGIIFLIASLPGSVVWLWRPRVMRAG